MASSESDIRQRGLSRDRVVEGALSLVQEAGIEALTMRALADRLGVKAASLYWHVRDRTELLRLVASSLLQKVPGVDYGLGWRTAILGACASFSAVVSTHRDAPRLLLEVPEVLDRSSLLRGLNERLTDAGLPAAEARQTARMMLVHLLYSSLRPVEKVVPEPSMPASVAVDTGSRGLALRAGAGMDTLARVPPEAIAAAVVVDGRSVLARRRRGMGRAEVELSPKYPWYIRVKGPTWNTSLDLSGLDVREIQLDGGTSRVDIILPRPRGIVPINVTGGVVGVQLHRLPGVPVAAEISLGALQVRLDSFFVRAATTGSHWESEGASAYPDRYAIRISSGAVQVTLDADAPPLGHTEAEDGAVYEGNPSLAIEVLLDGVERRVGR